MVSAWWIVLAFLGGGFAGVLVMALMYLAAEQPTQPAPSPDLRRISW